MKKEKPQSKKFIEKAKEIGADSEESAETFERAFKKIVPEKESKSKPS